MRVSVPLTPLHVMLHESRLVPVSNVIVALPVVLLWLAWRLRCGVRADRAPRSLPLREPALFTAALLVALLLASRAPPVAARKRISGSAA